MTRSQLVGFAVVGFIAGLVALPNTRWVVPTQVEVLSGGWRLERQSTLYIGNANGKGAETPHKIPLHVEPKDVLRSLGTPRSTDERLVALLQTDRNWGDDPSAYWARFDALFLVCQRLGTAPAWAQFVRLASMPAMVPLTGDPPRQTDDRVKVRTQLVEACVAGERLEPDNAFFPLVRSVALRGLGRMKEAVEALEAATHKPHYRAYEEVEPAMVEAALAARHPRSQLLRSWLTANVMLPHLTAIRMALRGLYADGSPTVRVAACRVGALMMREGNTLLDPYVGHVIVSDALRPYRPYPEEARALRIDASEATAKASTLAAETHAGDLVGIARDYALLAPAMHTERYTPGQHQLNALYTAYPLMGACALVALLALPFVLWISRLRAKFGEPLRWGLVHLVWLFAVALDLGVLPSDLPQANGFALFALLAPLTAYPRTRKLAIILSVLGCVVVVLAQRGSWAGWLLATLVVMALVSGRHPTASLPLSVAATLIACVVIGGVAGFAGTLSGPNALVAGIAALVALAPTIPSVRPSEQSASTAWAAGLLGCAYAITVLVGIRADAQAGAVNDALLHEASRLRAEVGVGQR